MESSTRHISVDFQPSYAQPDPEQLHMIGMVTYSAKSAPRKQIDKGYVTISTRSSNKLKIQYLADVQQG